MKIGLALSGGGIRGIAHAGVLKAFEENNIKIDIIGGTSSGSLIATLYALGYSPLHIFFIFKKYAKEIVSIDSSTIFRSVSGLIKNKKLNILGFNKGISLEKEYNELAKRKGAKKISDIKMPIVIPSVDINKSKEYVFTNKVPKENEDNMTYITDIPIGSAVRASSSFPGVFCPCEYKGYSFLDGGILDNIPVKEVKKQGAVTIIAVNIKADEIDEESNLMDITLRTIDIMGNKISQKSLELSDYVLTIQTEKTGLLDVDKLDNCYKFGYEFACGKIDEIKERLNI